MAFRLQAVLTAQDRSASWLARKTSRSPSYVHRVIHGQRRPSPAFREAAAIALGVPEELLFGAPEPEAEAS